MSALILIALFCSVFVVFAVLACVFLEVAFAGPRSGHELLETSQRWQPPLLRGDDLLAWATATAKAVTAKLIGSRRNGETAQRLTAEIHAGATFAIDRSPSAVGQREPNCPSCRHQMISVTPPEALAIADTIRRSRPRWEASRIHDQAAQNAALAADLDQKQYEQARVICPLLAGDGSCAVFGARPLHCRGWCRFCGADGDPCLHINGDAGLLDAHAYTVGRGAEQGLSQGLESAGLDGKLYELNGALVAALDTPNAAQRWAEGEPIFAGCKRSEYGSTKE